MQRFNVVVPLPGGGVSVYPMKKWLRRHPEHIPVAMSPTSSTSHQLRAALKKRGWEVQETADEIRLVMPGSVATVVVQSETAATTSRHNALIPSISKPWSW